MRIAMISEHASPLVAPGGVDAGGQNLHVAELATALSARGHEVRVYTRRHGDLPEIVDLAGGVQVVHVPAGPPEPLPKDELLPFMGGFGRYLAAQWERGPWRPDVAHSHFWMSGLAALTARARYPLPVVHTYHALGSVKRRYQGDRDTSPAQRIGYERVLGRQVDQVIAQCADEVGELVALGIPRAGIRLVSSGVDTGRFTPSGPRAQPHRAGGRILSVGRLVERKGYADLVEALPLVPEAEVVVIGGPPPAELGADPLARRLRRLAEQCGVADRFRLVGAVPRAEMPGWYRSADVVACAAWYEPFGLTPLEAMACGIPVVAYAVGGFIDTVVDQVTGVLVRPRDIKALAGALRALIGDPLRQLEHAAAAVDRARERYSWDRSAEQLIAVYAALAGVPVDDLELPAAAGAA
ncbi:MAG TPA: glycosyltransferase [Rugosimonospora sp.]|nr:glycosyltransferase [Rugosimonospora sp.]